MRIGMITGEYPPMEGGIADYTRILAREMVAAGHELYILTHPAGIGMNDAEIHVTAPVPNWNRAFFRTITDWIAQHQLDLVNLQYQTAAYNMAGLIHLLPLRVRNVPYITTFHDLRFPYLFPKAGGLRPFVVRLMARLSDGAIATNRGDENSLRGLVRHLVQIPLGATVQVYPASPDGREKIRQEMGVDEHTLVIGHFGFINASKGVDTLIHAAKLAEQQGINLKLMMIGGRTGSSDPTNQAYVQQIDQLAAQAGIEPHWTGFVGDEQIADVFAAAALIALPFRDGASLRRTSLQAGLAYSKAIVTTSPTDDNLHELVDGRDLIYVPPDDANALAAAIVDLARDSEKRTQLGQNAQLAAQQFQWDVIARRTLAFYATVIRAKKGE